MRKIEDVTLKDGKNLKDVLELHKKWLKDEEDGKRADLSNENLSDVDLGNLNLRYVILEGVNLSNAELSYVNLSYANLKGANLRSANLTDVNLSYANLKGAYLSYAYLEGANLTYVNLEGANLKGADLIGVNLEGANLTGANLTGANLTGAYLKGVDLTVANLIGTNLTGADLTVANLKGADLKGAYLIGANLTRAKLTNADLTGVKYNNITTSFALQCPEKGSFIGYKKANDKIVELLITEDAKRSSATTRKCRCSKAKVLSITSLDGKENFKKVTSDYYFDFVYEVGKIVEVKDFDENRWKECYTGIHFFITRDEAVMYQK